MSKCLDEKDLEYGWWRDPKKLKHEVDAHDRSHSAVERAHGVPRATLSKWWIRHGNDPLPVGRRVDLEGLLGNGITNQDEYEGLVLDALKKLGDAATVEELCDFIDIAPGKVRAALTSLGHQGYRVDEDAPTTLVTLQRHPIPSDREHEILFGGEVYRFGIATDTHLNSTHCRLDELHIAYDRFVAEGIDTVYNCGDITAGRGIYKGQDHEIINHTYATQVDYVVENYPVREGVVTKLISGNHDCEGDFGRAGADVAMAVGNKRDDIDWCGMYSADFRLPQGTLITMRHPMGGGAYAMSYTPQKFAESFEGGDKPNVVLFGHWHSAMYMSKRNIQMINGGTFEGGGNSLGKRKPLGEPAVGFWIVEMTVADDGSVVRFSPEWFPFYLGRRASQSALKKLGKG